MNLIRNPTTSIAIAALAVSAGLVACSNGDKRAAIDSAGGSTDTSLMSQPGVKTPPATTPAPPPAPTWSDAAILGYMIAANSGEVELGRIGSSKATNPAVKAFARKLVDEHRAMLTETKALGTKLSIAGDTSVSYVSDLVNHGLDENKELTTMKAGADWDKNFMDKMVDDHQKVLDKLQDASKNTANDKLRAALEKATAKVQLHLTKAKDIQANSIKA